MSRIRFEPVLTRELSSLQGDLTRFVDQIWGSGTDASPRAAWTPALDVWQSEAAISIALDVPGVPQDRISVELDGRRLTISGERVAEERAEGDRFYRFERRFGPFSRTLTLPAGIDEASIAATVRDGVLEITVQKPEIAKPRRIEVVPAPADVDSGSAAA